MPHFEPESLPSLQIAKGINARVVTGDTLTVLHVVIEAGAALPEHSHHHEQIVNLVEGEMLLTVDGTDSTMKSGDVMLLPPNVVHSGRAISRCHIIDVFHPVRKDFGGGNFAGYPSEAE